MERADIDGRVVRSNIVVLRIPSPTLPTAISSASLRIEASVPLASVGMGWKVPIEVVVKNTSGRTLRLAGWNGRSRTSHWILEAQEFGSGIEVRDERGARAPLTKQGQAYSSGDDIPDGSFIYVLLRPGEVWKETRVIGTISDIGAPGRYAAQVSLVNPATGTTIRSNPTTFTVLNAIGSVPEHHEAPAPFITTIRSVPSDDDPVRWAGREHPIQVCMTNIADRTVRLDNSITMDRIEVWNSRGDRVPMTEAGRSLQSNLGQGSLHNLYPISSGDSLCGDVLLDPLYDFSEGGDYFVQIERAAEPKANLLAKSNVLKLSVGH